MDGYVTFASARGVWRLHEGVGTRGPVLAERRSAPGIADLSPADQRVVWALLYEGAAPATAVGRLRLPDLDVEPVQWPGARLGAVTSSPSGEESVVLELPDERVEGPSLHRFHGSGWERVASTALPDVSSRLAWLEQTRIVYETDARRLAVLDLATGADQEGPEGHFPAVARAAREWYAITGSSVARFGLEEPFSAAPSHVEGFDVGEPTSIRPAGDGRALLWTEPRLLKRSKAFVQELGGPRQRLRELDDGIGAILGPGFLGAGEDPGGRPPS